MPSIHLLRPLFLGGNESSDTSYIGSYQKQLFITLFDWIFQVQPSGTMHYLSNNYVLGLSLRSPVGLLRLKILLYFSFLWHYNPSEIDRRVAFGTSSMNHKIIYSFWAHSTLNNNHIRYKRGSMCCTILIALPLAKPDALARSSNCVG